MREALAGSSGEWLITERERDLFFLNSMPGARVTSERKGLVYRKQDAHSTQPPAAGVRSPRVCLPLSLSLSLWLSRSLSPPAQSSSRQGAGGAWPPAVKLAPPLSARPCLLRLLC